MIFVLVPCDNYRARKWAGRWLPQVAPGVFIGEIHPQGRRRFFESLKASGDVLVLSTTGTTQARWFKNGAEVFPATGESRMLLNSIIDQFVQ